MSVDTLHMVGNYAIAIACLVVLAKWLHLPELGLVTTGFLAIFLPGIPLFVIAGVVVWRLIRRQPLRGPNAIQIEEARRRRDEEFNRLAGV